MRVQTARDMREADSAVASAAARTEHCAIEWMLQALGRAPPPVPMAEPASPASDPPTPEAAPTPDPVAEADVSFGPFDDSLVRPLFTGRTPALLAFDQQKLAMQAT